MPNNRLLKKDNINKVINKKDITPYLEYPPLLIVFPLIYLSQGKRGSLIVVVKPIIETSNMASIRSMIKIEDSVTPMIARILPSSLFFLISFNAQIPKTNAQISKKIRGNEYL